MEYARIAASVTLLTDVGCTRASSLRLRINGSLAFGEGDTTGETPAIGETISGFGTPITSILADEERIARAAVISATKTERVALGSSIGISWAIADGAGLTGFETVSVRLVADESNLGSGVGAAVTGRNTCEGTTAAGSATPLITSTPIPLPTLALLGKLTTPTPTFASSLTSDAGSVTLAPVETLEG